MEKRGAKPIRLGACMAAMLALAGMPGCGIMAPESEKAARQREEAVKEQYRPDGERPQLPKLASGSPFEDYLRYALLNSPDVESAYCDWAAAVARITVARSLPDPRLTFQMDILSGIPSLMPGLVFDFPGPGKLAAAADIASAASAAKYHVFVERVLQAAFELEKACWETRFLDRKLAALRESLAILKEFEALALTSYSATRATIQDVIRAQIEMERLRVEVKNLEDAKRPLLEEFKAALGMKPGQPQPPFPAKLPEMPANEAWSDSFLAEAFARNPGLQAMKSEIKMAEASLSLARKGSIPDFTAGAELNVAAAPVMARPVGSMTLPIWRDKVAAGIEAAQETKKAEESRLSSAQIALAVQCAEKSYLAREAARDLAVLRTQLIPKARESLAAAKIAYASGGADFLTLLDGEEVLLDFDIKDAEAELQRSLAVSELTLLVAGSVPAQAAFATPEERAGDRRNKAEGVSP